MTLISKKKLVDPLFMKDHLIYLSGNKVSVKLFNLRIVKYQSVLIRHIQKMDVIHQNFHVFVVLIHNSHWLSCSAW